MLRKLRVTSRRMGGGGGTSTSSTIPDWAIPYLKNVGDTGERMFTEGLTANTAGTNPLLQAASGSGAQAIADTTNQGIVNNQNQQGMIGAAQYGIGAAYDKLQGVYDVAALEADQLGQQQARLTQHATTGGYDTGALKDAAILDAGMKTAQLGNQYGSAGTLGSARQGVQQGAQNAATAANFAKIDQDAAQQNYQNKLAAEQGIGQSVQGVAQLGGLFNQTAGTTGQLASTGGQLAQTSAGIAGASQGLATNAAQAFSNLGSQQRAIEQENLDTPWTSLQRYASTIYGNPARQQTVAEGGK